jgi:predicted DNA-binding transcriptional regulator AlpA
MHPDESLPATPAAPAASYRVSLSPYVNERFPNWEELLSAHDVARLTRRPRWMVLSLTLLGRFPRKYRFRGRGIGWLRSEVLHWLAKDLRVTQCHTHPHAISRSRIARQGLLPLGRPPRTARRRLGASIDSKSDSDPAPSGPSHVQHNSVSHPFTRRSRR